MQRHEMSKVDATSGSSLPNAVRLAHPDSHWRFTTSMELCAGFVERSRVAGASLVMFVLSHAPRVAPASGDRLQHRM